MAAGLVVNRTRTEYIAVRAFIVLMRDLPWLLLGLWMVIFALGGVAVAMRPMSMVMAGAGVIEALFYFVFFLPYRAFLQTRPASKPPALDRAQRAALIYKSLDLVPDMVRFLRKWMNNAPFEDIRRENLKDWLLCALFERETSSAEINAELEQYIEEAENRLGVRLPAGRGDAEPIRPCFDPLIVQHRSLFYYMLIAFIDNLFCAYHLAVGWQYFSPANSNRLTFPLRLVHLMPRKSAGLSYWCRTHHNPSKRPIVFIHGLGAGLTPYVFWLKSIPDDVGVLAVELLPVSGRVTAALPGTPELCQQIAACVDQQRQVDRVWDDFVLVGNNYGTLLMGGLLQRPDFGPRVAAAVLIDPVSFLLHLPDVAYNFMRRPPRHSIRGRPGRGNEWQLWWGSATEADTAFTLARRVCWRESIMYREQLMPSTSVETGLRGDMRSTVILGGEDCVTCPNEVASYLWSGSVQWTPADREAWKAHQWTGREELEVVYIDGKDHGQSIMVFSPLPIIQRVLEGYCQRHKAV